MVENATLRSVFDPPTPTKQKKMVSRMLLFWRFHLVFRQYVIILTGIVNCVELGGDWVGESRIYLTSLSWFLAESHCCDSFALLYVDFH